MKNLVRNPELDGIYCLLRSQSNKNNVSCATSAASTGHVILRSAVSFPLVLLLMVHHIPVSVLWTCIVPLFPLCSLGSAPALICTAEPPTCFQIRKVFLTVELLEHLVPGTFSQPSSFFFAHPRHTPDPGPVFATKSTHPPSPLLSLITVAVAVQNLLATSRLSRLPSSLPPAPPPLHNFSFSSSSHLNHQLQ